jgi:von Willebrand factor type A domain-containing protein
LLAASLNACSSDEKEPGKVPDPNAGGDVQTCSTNDDCAGGTCGGNGRCMEAPMGSVSNDNFPDFLDSDGLAQPDDGSSCVKLDVKFDQVPPIVLLLIDQSSSMNDDFDGESRWDTLRDTLLNRDSSLLSTLQSEVRFGMVLYSSRNGSTGDFACPLLEKVEIKLDNFDDMRRLLDGADPVDDTPTAESVVAVTEQLEAVTEPGEKFLILATDGEPDTCADPDAQNAASRANVAKEASIAAVTAAFAKGITTRVISVGDEVGADHLKALAVAGSGGDQTAEAYTALNTTALEEAFSSIIGEARSCDFQLDGTVKAADAGRGTVTLDGEALVFGDANGWVMPDESTVRVQGSACDALQNSAAGILMDFPCGVYQVIPR